jgi:hypothetical protein
VVLFNICACGLTRIRSATAGGGERCFYFILHNSSFSLASRRPAVGCIAWLGLWCDIANRYTDRPHHRLRIGLVIPQVPYGSQCRKFQKNCDSLRSAPALLGLAKFERAVFSIDADGVAFSDFAFEDVDAEGVENFFLDRAPQRAGTVNRVVTFAREQRFG